MDNSFFIPSVLIFQVKVDVSFTLSVLILLITLKFNNDHHGTWKLEVSRALNYCARENLFVWLKSKIFHSIPGCAPYNGLYGEAPPKRCTFFTLMVYMKGYMAFHLPCTTWR